MVKSILPEKDNTRKEITAAYKNGTFTHQIDKLIREYIKTNTRITNNEIIV